MLRHGTLAVKSEPFSMAGYNNILKRISPTIFSAMMRRKTPLTFAIGSFASVIGRNTSPPQTPKVNLSTHQFNRKTGPKMHH